MSDHLNNISELLKGMKEALDKRDKDKDNINIERALEAQRRKTTIPHEVHEVAGQHLKEFQDKTLTPEQHQKLKDIKDIKARRAGMQIVKEECCKFDKNGQWSIEKSSYGPKGAGLYNQTDNINRKANRTGEEVADAGRNTAVHQWTTSGSSTDKARVANMQREQSIKNKKMPVKTTLSPEMKAELEAKANVQKDEQRTVSENAGGKNKADMGFKGSLPKGEVRTVSENAGGKSGGWC